MENAGGKKNIVKQLLYCHDVLGVYYSMAKSNGKTEKLSKLRLQAEVLQNTWTRSTDLLRTFNCCRKMEFKQTLCTYRLCVFKFWRSLRFSFSRQVFSWLHATISVMPGPFRCLLRAPEKKSNEQQRGRGKSFSSVPVQTIVTRGWC